MLLVYSPTALQAALVRGALLQAAKLLERPVYTCCLPSSSPISSSTHCFLTCSAPLNDSNSGQPCPRHTGHDLAGLAEEPDGRGRKKAPRGAPPGTTQPSLLMVTWHLMPSPVPLHFFLLWVGRRHLESSVEGETWTHDSAPSSFQIPACLHENSCQPVRPGAGPFICTCVSLSLRSHRDTLHTFPRDRPDPKTLDQGRPLRGGACPPGLSLHSHPPSD
ncbi:uncharacterized protein AAEQ78_012046 isoform 1-T1 [Lycaon pictus]